MLKFKSGIFSCCLLHKEYLRLYIHLWQKNKQTEGVQTKQEASKHLIICGLCDTFFFLSRSIANRRLRLTTWQLVNLVVVLFAFKSVKHLIYNK